MTIEDVLERMRDRTEREGSVAAWARRHAVSQVYARDVLAGCRPPGPGILEALGLSRDVSVTYREAPAHD